MNKLGRLCDWLLPKLICLSQMGAMAYYTAGGEIEAPAHESKRAARGALPAGGRLGAAIVPLARL